MAAQLLALDNVAPRALSGAGALVGDFEVGTSERSCVSDDLVTGWYEFHEVRPGFSLYAGNASYARELRSELTGGEDFKLHFKLQGKSLVSDEMGHEALTPAGTMAYLVQPCGARKFEQHFREVQETAVTFACSQSFLAELMNNAELNIPRPVSDFIEGRETDFHCGVMPLPATLHTLLGDILNPPYSGAFRTMVVHAKAMEVLCAALARIAEHGDESAAVRPRDLAKVRELCELLRADPFSNTSITRLSRMVAWNESQMTEQFRRITGMTVFGYRQKLRMDHALRLLQQTDQSITQIAFEAGYDHASNFATAFKRTFGFSPREARLGRKPFCTGLAATGIS